MDLNSEVEVFVEIQSFRPLMICFSAEFTQIIKKEVVVHQPVDFQKDKLPVGCSTKLEKAFPPKESTANYFPFKLCTVPSLSKKNNEVVVDCLFELKHR